MASFLHHRVSVDGAMRRRFSATNEKTKDDERFGRALKVNNYVPCGASTHAPDSQECRWILYEIVALSVVPQFLENPWTCGVDASFGVFLHVEEQAIASTS